MKFIVLDTFKIPGVNQQTGEPVHALFEKGTSFEGELVQDNMGQGMTMFTDGVFWQMPLDKVVQADTPISTAPLGQSGSASGNAKPSTDAPSAPPLWKHPQMPNYLGATIGGLIGMKLGEKLPILPGVLNWIVWTGIGGYLGYVGTKKLISTVQKPNEEK